MTDWYSPSLYVNCQEKNEKVMLLEILLVKPNPLLGVIWILFSVFLALFLRMIYVKKKGKRVLDYPHEGKSDLNFFQRTGTASIMRTDPNERIRITF